MNQSPICDAHCCVPLLESTDLSILSKHHQAGFHFISLNVGMDMISLDRILAVITSFKEQIKNSDFLTLAKGSADILHAKVENKLSVSFDLEGALPFHHSKHMVDLFYMLGVRQVHFAYNRNNAYAGGCYDEDIPLSINGKKLLRQLEHKGVLIDCSHTGVQSSLDIMSYATKPVIFSHSNSRSLVENPRNIYDKQIKACADTGGVVCLNGLNWFLGSETASTNKLLDHIIHVIEIVGIDHVGLGLDYAYNADVDDLPPDIDLSYWWPNTDSSGNFPEHNVLSPFVINELPSLLLKHGFSNTDINKLLGVNMFRVIKEVWK